MWSSVWLLSVGVKAGIDIDSFAPRLSFFWGIGMNFYMVHSTPCVAKLESKPAPTGGGKDACCAEIVGSPHERQAGSQGPQVHGSPLPQPDLWLVPHRTGKWNAEIFIDGIIIRQML